ncbi:hypothetical protein [Sulfitobacter aestuariivivens]|uniref:hypothetical protein n=1 Tax=Sulfitobacter aestuariivivens TaxID=2766981 RepID=UPI00360890E1
MRAAFGAAGDVAELALRDVRGEVPGDSAGICVALRTARCPGAGDDAQQGVVGGPDQTFDIR